MSRIKIFLYEIIASQLVPLNCLYHEQNTCHGYSMCQQSVLGYYISLRETFSDSMSLKVINKYDKGAVVQISRVFGIVDHVPCRRAF